MTVTREDQCPRTPSSLPAIELLSQREYRKLWVDSVLWQSGRWMWMIVSAYAVFQLTQSTFLTQLTGAALALPQLVTGIFIGAIADKLNRRNVLIANHIANFFISICTATLVITGTISWWHITGLSFAFGVFATTDQVTRTAFTADIVGGRLLSAAIALQGLAFTLGFVFGTLMGGVLLEALPFGEGNEATGPYLVISLLCLVGGLTIQSLKVTNKPILQTGQASSIFNFLGSGLRSLLRNPLIIGVLGITFLFNMTFHTYLPLIPVFADQVLSVSPSFMGILGACPGMGAAVGSLFIATRSEISKKSRYYIVGSLSALAFLQIFALSNHYPLSVAALICAGVGTAGFGTMQATLILTSVPNNMRGRAMGLQNTTIGVLPLGMLLLGALAEIVGPAKAVSISASLGFILIALWAYKAKALRQV